MPQRNVTTSGVHLVNALVSPTGGGADVTLADVAQAAMAGGGGAVASLDDVGDVTIAGVPDDNDVLVWQTDAWVNGTQEHLYAAKENGFVDRAESTLSLNDLTREVTITPTGVMFRVYSNGNYYEKTDPETVEIPDVEGLHWVYYDGMGVLLTTQNFEEALVNQWALVAVAYWKAAAQEFIRFGDERHGNVMDSATHAYNHNTFGTRFGEGLALTVPVIGDGSDDVHATIEVADGVIYDEDIRIAIANPVPQALSPVAIMPVHYIDASGWNRIAASPYPIATAGTGRAAWNEFNGVAFVLSEADDNAYVLTHIFATGDLVAPIIAVTGIAQYTTLAAARAGAINEILTLEITFGRVLTPEFKSIASLIWHTSDSYTNTVKSRIVPTAEGQSHLDWRTSGFAGGAAIAAPTAHASMTGLITGDDHPQYTLKTTEVATTHSLTGGGDLSTNRTLSLLNDTASPGLNKVYGTDGAGAKGWKDDPIGGEGSATFTGLTDTPTNYTDAGSRYLKVNAGASAVEFVVESNTPTTRNVATTHSLSGGGDLSADRTLSLLNDLASPGPDQVYGTDAAGEKGWKANPSGGSGSTTFIGLTDTPSNYTDALGHFVRVNAASDGLEYVDTSTLFQPLDTELTALAGTTSGADALPYYTGAGTASTTTLTTYGRSLVDDVDATTARGTLGLGTIATQAASNVAITGGAATLSNTGLALRDTDASHTLGIVPGSNLTANRTLTLTTGDASRTLTLTGDASVTGTNSGDQTITLTGNVTGSGTGSFATTIADDVVTNAKLTEMNANTIKGNNTAGVANPSDLTAAQTKTLLAISTSDVSGLGTIATQSAGSVAITGGSITGITDLAIADGGTGAGTAADAFTALKQAATTTATGVVELATSAETTAGLAVQANASDTRLSDARTPTSHTHGNITNAGAIGSTANLPLITTTSGVIAASSFGTTANTFCQGNDTRLHAAVTVSGTYDYITLSGQDIVRGQVDLAADVTGALPPANVGNLTTVTEAGTARTNTLADRGNFVRWTSGSAKGFVISSTVGAADGDVWLGINAGSSNALVLSGDGVTLTGALSFAIGKTYAIRFTSSTTADVIGGA
jgi:hypothetical protein